MWGDYKNTHYILTLLNSGTCGWGCRWSKVYSLTLSLPSSLRHFDVDVWWCNQNVPEHENKVGAEKKHTPKKTCAPMKMQRLSNPNFSWQQCILWCSEGNTLVWVWARKAVPQCCQCHNIKMNESCVSNLHRTSKDVTIFLCLKERQKVWEKREKMTDPKSSRFKVIKTLQT